MPLLVKFFWILVIVTLTGSCKSLETHSKQAAIMQEFPAITREPSLQAYGLPKRVLISNGQIERVPSSTGLAINNFPLGKENEPLKPTPAIALTNRSFFPHRILTSANEPVVEDQSRSISHSLQHHSTFKRSTDKDLPDLEAEESKVFRPLFVYRQQVANRHRAQRSRVPIYGGAYQYGRQPTNYRRDTNYRNHKSGNDERANTLN